MRELVWRRHIPVTTTIAQMSSWGPPGEWEAPETVGGRVGPSFRRACNCVSKLPNSSLNYENVFSYEAA